jgi:hypothetical protein
MAVDKMKVSEELEQLQLEEARERIAGMRAEKIDAAQRRMRVQQSLMDTRHMEDIRHAGCAHKKGGKGVEGLYRGNDANYAVHKHTLSSTGVTIVICIRCSMIWEPPKPLPKGASQKEREAYRKQLADYRWALALPTDNEPSGNQVLRVVENYYNLPDEDRVA